MTFETDEEVVERQSPCSSTDNTDNIELVSFELVDEKIAIIAKKFDSIQVINFNFMQFLLHNLHNKFI